ncbi:MAG: M16 family metallopeptidase [bacterium JZ-2024 1]
MSVRLREPIRWLQLTVASVVFCGLQWFPHPSGARIVIDEDPSVPLVTAMVVIASGSAVETPDTVGMSHLLEHLLFDGTTTRTRRQIYDELDRQGVLYNAFTREDYVAYFIVSPREAFRDSFMILCDMLFNSVIPEDELAKERKVVIEELTRDAERPDARVHEQFRLFALSGTPYRFPITGYKDTVATVPRETIYRHYQQVYQPRNMTLIFAGDLNEREARAHMNACMALASRPGQDAPVSPSGNFSPPTFDNRIRVTREALPEPRLWLALPAPPPDSIDAPSFHILQELLNDDQLAFQKAITGEGHAISSASFSYHPHRFASWVEAELALKNAIDYEKAVNELAEILARLPNDLVTPETVQRKARALIVSDLYTNESLTYRAMSLANDLGIGRDTDAIASVRDALEATTPERIRSVARRYFTPFRMRGMLVLPDQDSTELPEEIVWRRPAGEIRELGLRGGGTLIIRRSPGARVFSAHLLTRTRLGVPASAKPGVAELTFRMLFGGQSKTTLEDIGARVKVTDDPGIPFDDYYYSRHYGYVRFEAPMEHAGKALDLFLRGIFSPALSESALQDAKKEFSRTLATIRSRGSFLASNALYQALFGNSLIAVPFPGEPESLLTVTLTDILQYYAQAFQPHNVIISVVTNQSVEETIAKVERAMTGSSGEEFPQYPPMVESVRSGSLVYASTQSPTSTIYFAYPLPGYSEKEYARWQASSLVLSDIVQEELREKRGLAYSVGAGIEWGPAFSLLRISLTTSSENTITAVKAVQEVLSGLGRRHIPDDATLTKVVNEYWGRHLRYHQSAINQAYFLGFAKYLTGNAEWDLSHIQLLREVSGDEVAQTLSALKDPALWTVVVAGPVNPFESPAAPPAPAPR